ncbi:hypothetical protein [Gimesia sp.]|uniref:hypothetical protein n=1 Tax=Gimesia sp. TaxID=2024833 RepID=UPI003A92B319
MLVRLLTVVICLIEIHSICRAETAVPVRRDKPKNYAALSAENKTIEFGPFILKAEELNIWVSRDDQNVIRLKGDAQVLCGETRLKAETINLNYKDEHDLRIELKGNVKIENERDQLRMSAQHACLEYKKRFLSLTSSKHETVSLIRTQNEQTTEITATHILMRYKDLQTMLVQPIENVNINERQATLKDTVRVATTEPSQFDFFDQIAIAQINLFSHDWGVEARKPYVRN